MASAGHKPRLSRAALSPRGRIDLLNRGHKNYFKKILQVERKKLDTILARVYHSIVDAILHRRKSGEGKMVIIIRNRDGQEIGGMETESTDILAQVQAAVEDLNVLMADNLELSVDVE